MSLITTITATAPDLVVASETTTVQAGLLNWTDGMSERLRNVIQAVAITVAVVFVVYKAVQSKFAIGTIIVSALAAGVFVWIVHNVTSLQDSVGEDMPGSAPVVEYVDSAGPPV